MDLIDVSFEVDGLVYQLDPPTPRIGFAISRLFGGVGPVLARCQAGDLDAYKALLKHACPDAPKAEEDLEAFVFANVETLNWPLCRYAQSLQYGGRSGPIDDAGKSGEDGSGEGEEGEEDDSPPGKDDAGER